MIINNFLLLLLILYYCNFMLLDIVILTRRMFVIETASRACKITIIIKRSKVRKVNHAFLPEGIQIEDLTQASCHA